MKPFTRHKGIAAPLLRINVDTDAIIPSREIKAVSRHGLADGLFAGWRYTTPGSRTPNPDFVLNQPGYRGASILLAGANFGCGSSREHAVWALAEFGIRCIIAPGFGAIFQGNCVRNGLLPVVLPDEVVRSLADAVEVDPQARTLAVDLESLQVTAPDGTLHSFEVAATHRSMLLEGLDPIGATLKRDAELNQFETQDRELRSWAYLAH